MKISEILKRKGLFSKDIKQRFNNKQVKLNGEPTSDIELDVKVLSEHQCKMFNQHSGIFDAGDFIFELIRDNEIFKFQLQVFDFETLPISNIDNELTKTLKDFFIIRFSKRDVILLKKQ